MLVLMSGLPPKSANIFNSMLELHLTIGLCILLIISNGKRDANNLLFVNIDLTENQSSITTKQQGETQVQRGYHIQHVYSKEELLQIGQDLNKGSHLRQIHPYVLCPNQETMTEQKKA